jgi:hypothetical protein
LSDLRQYPSLTGATPDVQRELQQIRSAVYALQNQKQAAATPNASNLAATIKKQLEAGGSTPLNVTGLTGVLAQPQLANIKVVTTLPFQGPQAQSGNAVVYQGIVYVYDGQQWSAVGGPPQAWTNYTPTVAASGAMAWSGSTVTGKFQQTGLTVYIRVYAEGSLAGIPDNKLTISIPAAALAPMQSVSCWLQDGNGNKVAGSASVLSSTITLMKADGSSYALGSSVIFVVEGVYEAHS